MTGPAQVVFPALDRFRRQIDYLLLLQPKKTEVFSWEAVLPP